MQVSTCQINHEHANTCFVSSGGSWRRGGDDKRDERDREKPRDRERDTDGDKARRTKNETDDDGWTTVRR